MRRSVMVLLSLCAVIVGCSKAEDGVDAEIGAYSLFDPAAVNPALCGAGAVPFPNNAFFAQGSGFTLDTTLNIPSTSSTAVAANLTDGWSTTASAFTDVLGKVDLNSALNGGIVILEADATPRLLVPVEDFTVQTSTAMGQVSGTGGCAINATTNTGLARFMPISQQRTRILIEPTHPLNPSTTYIIAVTRDLLSADGVPVTANEFFPILNSDTKLCRLTGGEAGTEDLCTDATAPAEAAVAANAPVLTTMTAATPNPTGGPPAIINGASAAAVRLTTLENLRRNLVRPTVLAFKSLAAAGTTTNGPVTITDDDLVIAWSFTTQSTNASLSTMYATPGVVTAKTFAVSAVPNAGGGDLDGNGRLGTGELGVAGVANSADIFVGRLLAVPYYLDDASGVNDFNSQFGFWHNNGTITCTTTASCIPVGGFVPFTPPGDYDNDMGAVTPPTPAPCGAFAANPPVSTTNCHRIPVANANDAQGNPWGSLEDLPVMITVPKTARPTNGWPVVIFQHGITGNRTQMIPFGAAMASAGMVTVAIDLPLHGLIGPASPTNPFYQSGFERTFDLDISSNASGACLSAVPAGDGTTDASGTCFINLGSLITSRDNIRQAVADLLHLTRSLQTANPINLDLDGPNTTDDVDETHIQFAGLSLGSIVGTTLLGVDVGANSTADGSDEAIVAASLSVPGGGLGKLLDASFTFGPRIAVGLGGGALSPAPNGQPGVGSPYEGTDTYETFVRFAQHLVDPGDPINYAVRANANHRIHMTMVDGDTVVPNNAISTCPDPDTIPLTFATALTDNTNPNTRIAACEAGAELVGADPAMLTLTACAGATTVGICAGNATQDETLITGFLSGTEPLAAEMDLTVAGPITPPTQATNQNCAGLDVFVEFATGTHGSLLTPAGPGVPPGPQPDPTQFLAVTTEMQRQAATYLANDGETLGTPCP